MYIRTRFSVGDVAICRDEEREVIAIRILVNTNLDCDFQYQLSMSGEWVDEIELRRFIDSKVKTRRTKIVSMGELPAGSPTATFSDRFGCLELQVAQAERHLYPRDTYTLRVDLLENRSLWDECCSLIGNDVVVWSDNEYPYAKGEFGVLIKIKDLTSR